MGVTTPDYVCPMAIDQFALARPRLYTPGMNVRNHVAGA